MEMLVLGVSAIASIASLICFIMVVVAMFQNGATGMGIACIILAFCGIGFLIAFIMGWMNAKTWRIEKVMLIWSVCFVLNIVLSIAQAAMGIGFGFEQIGS